MASDQIANCLLSPKMTFQNKSIYVHVRGGSISTHFYQEGYVGDITHEGRKVFKAIVEKKDVFGNYKVLKTAVASHPKTAMKWVKDTITADNGGIMPEEII